MVITVDTDAWKKEKKIKKENAIVYIEYLYVAFAARLFENSQPLNSSIRGRVPFCKSAYRSRPFDILRPHRRNWPATFSFIPFTLYEEFAENLERSLFKANSFPGQWPRSRKTMAQLQISNEILIHTSYVMPLLFRIFEASSFFLEAVIIFHSLTEC